MRTPVVLDVASADTPPALPPFTVLPGIALFGVWEGCRMTGQVRLARVYGWAPDPARQTEHNSAAVLREWLLDAVQGRGG